MLRAERAHEGRHLFPNQQAENKQVSEVGLGSQPTEAKGPDPKVNTFQAARPVSQPWQDPTAGLRDAVVLNRGPIAARIAAPEARPISRDVGLQVGGDSLLSVACVIPNWPPQPCETAFQRGLPG